MDGSHQGEDEERRALAALMDPAALERRLAEARLRREAALAARGKAAPEKPVLEPSPARPARPAAPEGPGPLVAPARAPSSAAARRRSGRNAPLAAIFVAGSLAGALAAGLGPRALSLLSDPPQPPPGIAADLSPPPPPAAAAPPVLFATDSAARAPARAIPPAALPERPFIRPLITSLDGTRIALSAPSGADAAAVAAAMGALEDANPGSLTRADARVTISTANVRYFHATDRPAATEIAALLGAALGSDPAIRDFTDFRPAPSKGAIEVWLPGEAPAATARRATRPETGPAAIVMDSVRRARDALERTLEIVPVITLR